MTRRAALVVAVVVLGIAGAAPARADKMPACVHWWQQVVAAGFGYNHVVGIDNGCDKPVACVITTDVAPDPLKATVPGKQKVELVTFRGSPASTFKAKVECSLP